GTKLLGHSSIKAALDIDWDERDEKKYALERLLQDAFALRRNRSLWTRIHTRIRLPDPEPGETVEYVRHRLNLAGVKRELFSSDALALLHEGTGGRLRDIDRLATTALKTAARAKLKLVDRAIVLNVANSHQR
ncbi:MAG: hypothetical protein GY769_21635, partial [bacterium]|nr:hypothetical protein [bacterium]